MKFIKVVVVALNGTRVLLSSINEVPIGTGKRMMMMIIIIVLLLHLYLTCQLYERDLTPCSSSI